MKHKKKLKRREGNSADSFLFIVTLIEDYHRNFKWPLIYGVVRPLCIIEHLCYFVNVVVFTVFFLNRKFITLKGGVSENYKRMHRIEFDICRL